VPYTLVGEHVEARLAASTVEIYRRSERVASHVRSFERGGTTTLIEHMPRSHQKQRSQSVAELEAWAANVGPCTMTLVRAILDERRHPEHGYGSCVGLKSLMRHYAPERIEAACERALVAGARSYLNVESILRHGLDRQPLPTTTTSTDETPPAIEHENIRGPGYYH
jgi:transposase